MHELHHPSFIRETKNMANSYNTETLLEERYEHMDEDNFLYGNLLKDVDPGLCVSLCDNEVDKLLSACDGEHCTIDDAHHANLEENDEARLGVSDDDIEDEILLLASQQYKSEYGGTVAQKEGARDCTIDNFEDKLLLEALQQYEAKFLEKETVVCNELEVSCGATVAVDSGKMNVDSQKKRFADPVSEEDIY